MMIRGDVEFEEKENWVTALQSQSFKYLIDRSEITWNFPDQPSVGSSRNYQTEQRAPPRISSHIVGSL